MKIVCKSNFDDEAVAEYFVAENIKDDQYASVMVCALNDRFSGTSARDYFLVVQDDYKLWRGMEELV